MEIKITKRSGNWTYGRIGGYKFEIKHFAEPSEYGIPEGEFEIPGRISKLWLSSDLTLQPEAVYDRGWDKLPRTDSAFEAMTAILDRFN